MGRHRRTIRLRTTAVAVTAVIAGGAVVVEQPRPAQAASWSSAGTATTWISGMNSALGNVGKLLGREFTGASLFLDILGPTISTIFGGDTGPGIQDVLDRLQQLDDIERKLDQLQVQLADVKQNVLELEDTVVLGQCVTQSSDLPHFITSVETSQAMYTQVIEKLQRVQDNRLTNTTRLQGYMDDFVDVTLGTNPKRDVVNVETSPMAHDIREAHQYMVTHGSTPGVIQTCGRAHLTDWKLNAAGAAARQSAGQNDVGVWLDDRQYYAPVQDIVTYWQTVQAQGMYLLQQASLMQASKLYTTKDHGSVPADAAGSVCALAAQSAPDGQAATVCESALTFYAGIVAEWTEVGLPISNDDVVMSLGTDITGVTNAGVTMDSPCGPGSPAASPSPGRRAAPGPTPPRRSPTRVSRASSRRTRRSGTPSSRATPPRTRRSRRPCASRGSSPSTATCPTTSLGCSRTGRTTC